MSRKRPGLYLAAGTCGMRVRRFGFMPKVVQVKLTGSNEDVHLVLAPLPTQLDTVRQSALAQDLPRPFERAEKGISLLKFGPELQAEFPGVSIDDILRYDRDIYHELHGHRCDNWFLDGKPFAWVVGDGGDAYSFSLNSMVRMQDVAAVEVIRFAGIGVQEPWFIHRGPPPCAIFIWTKGFKQKPYPH